MWRLLCTTKYGWPLLAHYRVGIDATFKIQNAGQSRFSQPVRDVGRPDAVVALDDQGTASEGSLIVVEAGWNFAHGTG